MSVNNDWINSAYEVVSGSENQAMHISQIQQEIVDRQLVSKRPSLPLEVLLTKEAAMGRLFTRPEGAEAGYFSLLKSSSDGSSYQSQLSNDGLFAQPDIQLSQTERYKIKYKQLKRTAMEYLHLNAALYDEVARIDKKTQRVANERSTLLKRLMAHQNIPEPTAVGSMKRSKDDSATTQGSLDEVKKAKLTQSKKKKKRVDGMISLIDPNCLPANRKNLSNLANPVKINPIATDDQDKPILPIELGAGLTITNLGEIYDRSGYSCPSSIFPVGYRSTREFSSLRDPNSKALYTCKVSEGPSGPQFEISPDDEPAKIFVDNTPEGCHNKLMQVFRLSTGLDLGMSMGSDFFGLKHPMVKNLLQKCPGARKCNSYSWCKYEVVKEGEMADNVFSESDPTCAYDCMIVQLQLVGS